MINDFLVKLLNGHTSRALEDLEKKSPNDCMDEIKTMLRLAIFQLENSLLHYQKIYNLWKNLGSPSLKPNPTRKKVFLLRKTECNGENFRRTKPNPNVIVVKTFLTIFFRLNLIKSPFNGTPEL